MYTQELIFLGNLPDRIGVASDYLAIACISCCILQRVQVDGRNLEVFSGEPKERGYFFPIWSQCDRELLHGTHQQQWQQDTWKQKGCLMEGTAARETRRSSQLHCTLPCKDDAVLFSYAPAPKLACLDMKLHVDIHIV